MDIFNNMYESPEENAKLAEPDPEFAEVMLLRQHFYLCVPLSEGRFH